MFQDYALFPAPDILENVLFGLQRLLRREGAQTRRERRSRASGCEQLGRRLSRTCCPAASSSAWRWPAPSRRGPACC